MKKADPDRAARLGEALRTNLRRRRGLEPGPAELTPDKALAGEALAGGELPAPGKPPA